MTIMHLGNYSSLSDFDGSAFILTMGYTYISNCNFDRGSVISSDSYCILTYCLFKAGSSINGGELRCCYLEPGVRLNGKLLGRAKITP